MSHLSALLRTSAALVASLALVACADPAATNDPAPEAPAADAAAETDETSEATEDLSAVSKSYVAIRRDYRKCISPLCGGYWVSDVNRKVLKETYVSSLDFSKSGLDEAAQAVVSGAPDGTVIVRANLGKVEPKYKTRPLIVHEAFRGLPNQASVLGQTKDSVYSVQNLGIVCITSPCPTFEIKRLNYTPKTRVSGVDVDFGGFVDAWWLLEEVSRDGGLVLGSVRAGEQRPGGVESILDAAQVFLKVPEKNNCPQFKLANCEKGFTHSYHRDEHRCILPEQCVPIVACKKLLPVCEDGYTLVSWTSVSGCNDYACDPTWIFPEQQ